MNRRSGTGARMLIATVSGAIALAVGPATVFAGSLDQSQQDTTTGAQVVCGPDSDYSGECPFIEAQTFTAGASGVLDQVDLHVIRSEGSDPLYVSIFDTTAGGLPGTQVLAIGTINDATSAGWQTVQFDNLATVVAGTRYAIVAATANNSHWGWSFDYDAVDNPYDGGSRFTASGSPPSAWAETVNADNAFRTFVTPINDLQLSMVGPASIKKGSTFTYLLTVDNAGDAAAPATLTDTLPFGVTYVTATTSQGSCSTPGKKVRVVDCDLGSIAAHENVTVAITVKAAARAGSFLNNLAHVASSAFDPDQDNNAASLSTAVVR